MDFFLFLLCFVCFFVLKVMVILSSIFNSIIFLLSFFLNQSIKKKNLFFDSTSIYIDDNNFFSFLMNSVVCSSSRVRGISKWFCVDYFSSPFFYDFWCGRPRAKNFKRKFLKIFIWRLHSRVLGFFNNSH